MKSFALWAALAVCTATSYAESVTLYPSQDSDVYHFQDAPTSTIYTLGVSASGDGAPHSQKSLIQFDLSPLTIPAAQIGTATLRLYGGKPDVGTLTPGNVSIYSQDIAWTVATLHWATFTPGEFVATLPVLTTSVNSWSEVDVTALVKEWAAGTKSNYGFLLQPETETAPLVNIVYSSMEVNAVPGIPDSLKVGPQLVVTRAVAPVAPPVLTVALNAAGDSVVLSWPAANATGWTLQQATDPGGSWTTDTTASTTTADGKVQVVHPVSGAPMAFYRLSK